MKWPDDRSLPDSIRDQLDRRINRFLQEDPGKDGANDSLAVQDLILDLYSIITSSEGETDEGLRLMELIQRGGEWDTDEPRLAHIQKYINRIFHDRRDDAYRYMDKYLGEKAREEAATAKAAIIESGGRGGKAKNRETSAAIERAKLYYSQHHNQFKSKKQAAAYCEEHFPPVKFNTYCRVLRKP